jgi:hypothetical protein
VPPFCHVCQRGAGGDEIHHAAEALEGALGVVLILKVDFAAAAGVAVAQRLVHAVQHRGWGIEARLRRAVAVDVYLRPRRARTRAFGVVIGVVVLRRFRVGKRVVVLHSLFVRAARQDWVPLGHALDPRVGLVCKRGRAWSCGLRPARGRLPARVELRVDVDNIDVGPLLQVVCQQLAQRVQVAVAANVVEKLLDLPFPAARALVQTEQVLHGRHDVCLDPRLCGLGHAFDVVFDGAERLHRADARSPCAPVPYLRRLRRGRGSRKSM